MTKIYSTQIVPDPPKQRLFLSPVELNACYDIDKNGIDNANPDSRMKLEFLVASALASCFALPSASLQSSLTNEITHFAKTWPHTKPAGLMLSVDVLSPIYEEINGTAIMEIDDSDNPGEGQ